MRFANAFLLTLFFMATPDIHTKNLSWNVGVSADPSPMEVDFSGVIRGDFMSMADEHGHSGISKAVAAVIEPTEDVSAGSKILQPVWIISRLRTADCSFGLRNNGEINLPRFLSVSFH